MSISHRNSKKNSSNESSKGALGARGERLAVKYLEDIGMKILARNWASRVGEIDIVAMDGETLCFIEVRSKASEEGGHPLETITAPKQKQVAKAAKSYLMQAKLGETSIRFDAIGIVFDQKPARLRHVRNAFEAWNEW